MTSCRKIFLAPALPGEPLVRFVSSFNHQPPPKSTLFAEDLQSDFHYTGFEFVEDIASADFVLVPSGIPSLAPKYRAYLNAVRALAQPHKKKIIVFVVGDYSHKVRIDDMIVLKGSQYASLKRANEYIVPPFVEDLQAAYAIPVREKREGQPPVIGFCGWAGFARMRSHVAYYVRNALLDCYAFVAGVGVKVFKKGIWYRRRAMCALASSPLVKTNFVTRASFSASLRTISLDPAAARKEFIQNFTDSDFALAPKGDANYSVRFYEALAAGRVPILIDTDACLVGEEYIPYDEFIIRVPWRDIDKLPEIVRTRWDALSSDDFAAMQHKAREAYVNELRYDAFFNRLFGAILQPCGPDGHST